MRGTYCCCGVNLTKARVVRAGAVTRSSSEGGQPGVCNTCHAMAGAGAWTKRRVDEKTPPS